MTVSSERANLIKSEDRSSAIGAADLDGHSRVDRFSGVVDMGRYKTVADRCEALRAGSQFRVIQYLPRGMIISVPQLLPVLYPPAVDFTNDVSFASHSIHPPIPLPVTADT